jgi:hypothetical protein
MVALGGEVGFWLPTEDLLEAGPTIAGLFEYYLTPRVGLRTTLGWAQNDFEFEEDDGLRTNRLTFSLLYNWEHGKWHPFVGAGAGAYFLQRRDNGSDIGDSETEPGFHVGGGIDYFTARTVSIKGEGLYHIVSDDPGLETSGLTLTIGLKKYF